MAVCMDVDHNEIIFDLRKSSVLVRHVADDCAKTAPRCENKTRQQQKKIVFSTWISGEKGTHEMLVRDCKV